MKKLKDFIFPIKEYWTWKQWCRVILCIAVITAFIVWAVYAWNDANKTDMHSFVRQYQGYQWQDSEDNQPQPVTFEFDGVMDGYQEFEGSIVIRSADEVLHCWEDCRIYNGVTAFFVFPGDVELEYIDPGHPEEGRLALSTKETYAAFFPNEDMSGFTILLPFEGNYRSDGYWFTVCDSSDSVRAVAQEHLEDWVYSYFLKD